MFKIRVSLAKFLIQRGKEVILNEEIRFSFYFVCRY